MKKWSPKRRYVPDNASTARATASRRQPFVEGIDAFTRGRERDANPYPERSVERADWACGFLAGSRAAHIVAIRAAIARGH